MPKITAQFNSLDDVAWYASSYLIATCCTQLLFGKLYAEFDVKWVFLASMGLFEAGSIVCGAAPSSLALILGRAVSGVGVAGVVSGALIVSFWSLLSLSLSASSYIRVFLFLYVCVCVYESTAFPIPDFTCSLQC